MLTLEDCLGMCELDEEEILAVAEHEHIPEIVAIEMSEYIVHLPDGVPRIKRMIIEDISNAEECGKHDHADCLKLVLKYFIANHPEYSSQA